MPVDSPIRCGSGVATSEPTLLTGGIGFENLAYGVIIVAEDGGLRIGDSSVAADRGLLVAHEAGVPLHLPLKSTAGLFVVSADEGETEFSYLIL